MLYLSRHLTKKIGNKHLFSLYYHYILLFIGHCKHTLALELLDRAQEVSHSLLH